MVRIREECNIVLKDHRIWNVNINKCMRVEEFKQHQQSSSTALKSATGENGWVDRLCKIIKESFKGVGKGWFNLNVTEDEKESYEFGKLKKFLQLVNFMMQDTILNLCKDSVDEFVVYMLDFIPDHTEITSAAAVKNRFDRIEQKQDDDEEPEYKIKINDTDSSEVVACKQFINEKTTRNKNPEPLFLLDLILKPKELIPVYSTTPSDIVDKIRAVFEQGIKDL